MTNICHFQQNAGKHHFGIKKIKIQSEWNKKRGVRGGWKDNLKMLQ